MSALRAVDAVVQLAQQAYEQGELIADLASGIVDSRPTEEPGARLVRVTLQVSPETALRLQNATGVRLAN